MHVSYRILLSCAVLSAVFAQASLWSAAACADEDDDFVAAPVRPAPIGGVHLIVARSTSEDDPLVKDAGDYWLGNIRGIMGFEGGYGYIDSPCPWAFDDADCFGVGLRSDDYASARFLEGQDVAPRNLVQTCREVSQDAGPDDAIVVFVWSRAAQVPGSSGLDRHVLFPMATSDDYYDRGEGVPCGTILKALKEKEHRLIILITFSYEAGVGDYIGSLSGTSSGKTLEKQPEPRKDSFLKALMQEAVGEINIDVDSVLFPNSNHYFDPFNLVVLNGLYLNSEINVDSFYKHLSFARDLCSLEHERAGFAIPYRIQSHDDNSHVNIIEAAKPESFDERRTLMLRLCAERREKLMQSAEIEKRERYFDERQLNYFRPQ